MREPHLHTHKQAEQKAGRAGGADAAAGPRPQAARHGPSLSRLTPAGAGVSAAWLTQDVRAPRQAGLSPSRVLPADREPYALGCDRAGLCTTWRLGKAAGWSPSLQLRTCAPQTPGSPGQSGAPQVKSAFFAVLACSLMERGHVGAADSARPRPGEHALLLPTPSSDGLHSGGSLATLGKDTFPPSARSTCTSSILG